MDSNCAEPRSKRGRGVLNVRPRIATKADLVRFVVVVTASALCLTLLLDGANQMVFFESWSVVIRSWVLDVVIVIAVTVPVTVIIGTMQRELTEAKAALKVLSLTDALTGLPNRRALLNATHLLGSETIILFIVDIDRFKRVNDTYGHVAGDAVIKSVADLMSSTMHGLATLARVGGEEFAAFAPSDRAEQLISRVEQFRAIVEATSIRIDAGFVGVTVSVGWAIRSEAEPFEHVYLKADEALYRAKEAGRNRIESYTALHGMPRSLKSNFKAA